MRLGTRGSALALAQARPLAEALGAEIVPIRVSGDAPAAAGPTDKSRWVDAIEDALLRGDVDIAVHSAKDVPAELAEGLELVGATAREDPRDALVGADSVEALGEGARVGTSSLRRRAQLLATRPDLDIVALRGNVDTRLRKLADSEVDALVLAAAGLRRLGREDAIGALLDPAVFVPAAGQGILALEARPGVDVAAVADDAALAALTAEREVVHALGATCNTPIGAHADGAILRTWVGLPDGSAWIRDELGGGSPAQAVERLLSMGAADLLARAETLA